jgi:hydrogenase expression/formation protein HypC
MNAMPDAAPSCTGDHCITCADEGIPMRVLRVDERRGIALCVAGDGSRGSVEVELVGTVEAGESILVHAGVALVKLERDGAV